MYIKTCIKGPLKKLKKKNGFSYRLLLNAGQKYCRMLQWEHSAILSTFIKLPFVIKIFVLSIFERPLKTGFIVALCSFYIFKRDPFSRSQCCPFITLCLWPIGMGRAIENTR